MFFADRLDAGQRLAARLEHLRGQPVVVLGLPRGGVPVAFEVARESGSAAHDPIAARGGRFVRSRNRAGGLEGGVTNGEDVVVRVAFKPISTLMRPLPSADLVTGEDAPAHIERSDVCVVPAAGVVAEAMLALILADALLERFGADEVAAIVRGVEAARARSGPLGGRGA